MSGQQFCQSHSQSAYKATNHQSTFCRLLRAPLMLNIIVVSCRSSDSYFPLTSYSLSCYNRREWLCADTHSYALFLPVQQYLLQFMLHSVHLCVALKQHKLFSSLPVTDDLQQHHSVPLPVVVKQPCQVMFLDFHSHSWQSVSQAADASPRSFCLKFHFITANACTFCACKGGN